MATKVSLFIVNYGRELKIGVDIKIKKSRKDNRVCGKNEKKNSEWSRDNIEEDVGENKVTSK